MNITTLKLNVLLSYRREKHEKQYTLTGITYRWSSKSSRLKAPWFCEPITITSNLPTDIVWNHNDEN